MLNLHIFIWKPTANFGELVWVVFYVRVETLTMQYLSLVEQALRLWSHTWTGQRGGTSHTRLTAPPQLSAPFQSRGVNLPRFSSGLLIHGLLLCCDSEAPRLFLSFKLWVTAKQIRANILEQTVMWSCFSVLHVGTRVSAQLRTECTNLEVFIAGYGK